MAVRIKLVGQYLLKNYDSLKRKDEEDEREKGENAGTLNLKTESESGQRTDPEWGSLSAPERQRR